MKKIFISVVCAGSLFAVPSRADPDLIRVHIESDSPDVELQVATRGRGGPIVCRGTCDEDLPLELGYRIVGNGIAASKPFTLVTGGDRRTTMHVTTGSSAWRRVGLVSLIVGLSGIPLGGFTLATAALSERCSSCIAGYADTTMLNVGWTILGVGAVLIAFGGIAFANSGTSVDFTVNSLSTISRKPEFEKRVLGGPPMVGVPIFSTTF